jgi:hypothetical protein
MDSLAALFPEGTIPLLDSGFLRMDKVARKVPEKGKEEEDGAAGARKPSEEEMWNEDGACEVEKIVTHAVDRGVMRFKVRFVGYGAEDDLWYEEKELMRTMPEGVKAYKAEQNLGGKQKDGAVGEKNQGGKTGAEKRRGTVAGRRPRK